MLRPSSGQIQTADNDETVCHIDCLPEELLSYIFCLARPEELVFLPKKGETLLLAPEHLFNVPYVCRRWRNVVLALPVLAPCLDITCCHKNHQPRIHADGLREMRVRFLTSFENKYVNILMTTWDYDTVLALRSAPFIRTLHIDLDPCSPGIFYYETFMEASMPHLESLSICCIPSRGLFPGVIFVPDGRPWALSLTSSPYSIFKSTPNLRRLCLERYIDPPNFAMPWHQIQELVLLHPQFEVWSETLPLMDLRVLTLLGKPMSSASKGMRITLQHLRILNISQTGEAATGAIDMLITPSLQFLRCPLTCVLNVSGFLSRSSSPLLVVCLEMDKISFGDGTVLYFGHLHHVFSVLPASVEELQLELQPPVARVFRRNPNLAHEISRMLEPGNGRLPQLHSLSLTMDQHAVSSSHGRFMPTVVRRASEQEKCILSILRARWGQPGAATPKQVRGKKKKRRVHLERKRLQDDVATTPIMPPTRPSPLRIFRLGVPRKDLSRPAKSAFTRFSNDGLEVFLDCEPRSFSIFERVRPICMRMMPHNFSHDAPVPSFPPKTQRDLEADDGGDGDDEEVSDDGKVAIGGSDEDGVVLRPSSGQIDAADNDDTVCHIDCLPEELLSFVFCLARPEKLVFSPNVEGDTLLLGPEHLFNVPYVCRRWRDVVLALPVLAPSLDISWCSRNHQTREIGVRFVTSFENKYVGIIMTSSHYDEVLALRAAPLVRTLHMILDPFSPRIFNDKEFMETPMPHMESLSIFCHPLFAVNLPNRGLPWLLSSFTSSPHPFFKSTPNLHRLSLNRYIEPQTFAMPWHQVQELVLLDPTLGVWSETLPLMDLRVLTLLGKPMSSASQGMRITLQHLRILNISQTGVAATDAIDMLITPSLQSLRCPLSCEMKISEFLSRSSSPLLVVCLVMDGTHVGDSTVMHCSLHNVLSVLPPSVEELQLELQPNAAQEFREDSTLACKISCALEPVNGLLPQLHSLSLTMDQNFARSIDHAEFMPTGFGCMSEQEKYILAILRARWGQPGAATPKQVRGKKKKKKKRRVHLERKKLQDDIGTTPITAPKRPSPLRIFRLGVPRKDLSPPAKSALTRFSNDGLEIFLDCGMSRFHISEDLLLTNSKNLVRSRYSSE
ncbi:hypothetical protein FISHEDRAFT_70711 [Fistulina hepatica ATCC 64428]|uniref:F-box domain-containing protein n=1 Tax=Fistulina hepatica ATCC 64428 TaxID=1128425 RepID=A0A0D7AIA9_9AGAR|nr:hypothetical protein FISHEDRAFT_70711 [Fistulina hepatica ATCC 64428]